MTDSCEINETSLFMASDEGKMFLEGIRAHLKGRTIVEVEFADNTEGIGITLMLDDGDTFSFNDEELSLDVLYQQFRRIFEA